MNKLVYGTTNKGKIKWIREVLEGSGVEIIALDETNCSDYDSDKVEIYDSPDKNALAKAKFFYDQIKVPVLSADTGMYFCDYDKNDPIQPGVNVRRVNGERLNDDEMRDYYMGLASKHGGKIAFRYYNSLAIIKSETEHYSIFDSSTASVVQHLVDRIVDKNIVGFPLDQITEQSDEVNSYDGYREFITSCFNK